MTALQVAASRRLCRSGPDCRVDRGLSCARRRPRPATSCSWRYTSAIAVKDAEIVLGTAMLTGFLWTDQTTGECAPSPTQHRSSERWKHVPSARIKIGACTVSTARTLDTPRTRRPAAPLNMRHPDPGGESLHLHRQPRLRLTDRLRSSRRFLINEANASPCVGVIDNTARALLFRPT
jgi:hypothetical protein